MARRGCRDREPSLSFCFLILVGRSAPSAYPRFLYSYARNSDQNIYSYSAVNYRKKISPQAPLSNRPKHQTLQTPLGPRRGVALDPDLVLEGLDRAIYLRGQFGLGVALR